MFHYVILLHAPNERTLTTCICPMPSHDGLSTTIGEIQARSIPSHFLVNVPSPSVNTLPAMGDTLRASPLLDASTLKGSTISNLGDFCTTTQEYIKQIERVKYTKKHAYQMKPFKPKVDLLTDLQELRVQENTHLHGSVSTYRSLGPRLMESSTMQRRERSASICSSRDMKDECLGSLDSSFSTVSSKPYNVSVRLNRRHSAPLVTSPLARRRKSLLVKKASIASLPDSGMDGIYTDEGFDERLSPRNASFNIKSIGVTKVGPIVSPRRMLTVKSPDPNVQEKSNTVRLFPKERRMDLGEYKKMYMEELSKVGGPLEYWNAFHKYRHDPGEFQKTGKVIKVAVLRSSNLEEPDLSIYEKLYREKLFEENQKTAFVLQKSKLKSRLDKSPDFRKLMKKKPVPAAENRLKPTPPLRKDQQVILAKLDLSPVAV